MSLDGLMTEADRGSAPMACPTRSFLAYRERMLQEFEELAPVPINKEA
jgi:hypothetical protein